MYVPPKFQLGDDDSWGLVAEVGAATLVLATSNGLESAFAPVIVSEDRRKLYSHLARANAWWRAVTPDAEVLALFVAASAYVSPLNYPSRHEAPDVVPTWNYVMVQVRGRVRIHDDAHWKLEQVRALTHHFERRSRSRMARRRYGRGVSRDSTESHRWRGDRRRLRRGQSQALTESSRRRSAERPSAIRTGYPGRAKRRRADEKPRLIWHRLSPPHRGGVVSHGILPRTPRRVNISVVRPARGHRTR